MQIPRVPRFRLIKTIDGDHETAFGGTWSCRLFTQRGKSALECSVRFHVGQVHFLGIFQSCLLICRMDMSNPSTEVCTLRAPVVDKIRPNVFYLGLSWSKMALELEHVKAK